MRSADGLEWISWPGGEANERVSKRIDSIAIGLATFHRTEMVKALIPLLLAQLDELAGAHGIVDTAVVVVDNDPAGSARDAVCATGDDRVRYAIEDCPGLSAARNRVVDEAVDFEVLVFLDDDERPHDGWLAALLSTFAESDADAVGGPVQLVPLGEADAWVQASGLLAQVNRAGLLTGSRVPRAATNNLLLDLRRVRALGVRFDDRFAFSGGEDSFFTGTFTDRGATIRWCAEAVVDDLIPPERLTREYHLRKRRTLSNSGVRADVLLARSGPQQLQRRLRWATVGVVQILKGTTSAIVGALRGSLAQRARGELKRASGVGALTGSVGRATLAYGGN